MLIHADSSSSFWYDSTDSVEFLPNSTLISALSSGNTDIIGLSDAALIFVYNRSLYDLGSQPTSTFPFGRLAFLVGNSSDYIYHQLNETHLLEEILVAGGQNIQWAKPNYIVISTDGS